MARVPDLPCADCGKLMWSGTTSLPPGQARCQPCRRSTSKPAPTRIVGSTGTCERCGKRYVRVVKSQRLCRQPCVARKSGTSVKAASTTERGYTAEHQRRRAEALADWQDGDPCARCNSPMLHGTPVDLDHTDDRTGYLGLSHRACNRSRTQRLDSIRVDKVCDHCGVTYLTRWRDQRFCSVPCRKAGHVPIKKTKRPPLSRTPELRVCSECPTIFLTTIAKQVTCTSACGTTRNHRIKREQYGAKLRHYQCACCGAPCVTAHPSPRFCSAACSARAKKRRDRGKPEASPVLPPRFTAPRYRGKGAKDLAVA